ncbi:unnamed protein product [Cyclocybe aegerita]|uniref:Thioredoxin domain-containing protein n=1 Tax=Cyclocybe aegerita TaxID=1973307 RepID=A0A8S0VUR9_CYCAE|nr:unnamed protein product [Cyclocybe aegerita]
MPDIRLTKLMAELPRHAFSYSYHGGLVYLIMFFLNLPKSLICSSFLFLTAAVPVSAGIELTMDNFPTTVDKGLWFIEHFSPYCGHCKHFKPTWDQLAKDAEEEIPSVKLATVNCVTQGDLCNQNKVTGYPQLMMYEDGKMVSQFKGAREMDALKKFIKGHVKEEPAPPPPPPPPPPAPKAAQEPPKPVLNTAGEVVTLTAETFGRTLAQGPAFVKFFAPWCGHCKKLAPTWKQLARHMQGKLTVAEVNCDDSGSLCKKQNIQGYPTLVWFGQGENEDGRSEYTSGRKIDQLKAFAEKASAAGVHILEKADDLDAHVAEADVVYLLLHSASSSNVLKTIREASAPLLGSPEIFASSSDILRNRFSIPSSTPWALVAIKDHDMNLPSSTYLATGHETGTDADLRKWLLTHRVPTAVELTQDSFQGVMNAPQAPLVVIVSASGTEGSSVSEQTKAKILRRIKDVAKKWRVRTEGSGLTHGREVVFAWMDGSRWAEWLKSMYGFDGAQVNENGDEKHEVENVRVVVADHSRLVYYDGDRTGNAIKFTSSASIFAAVEDAACGKSQYKHSENLIERMARYLNGKMTTIEFFVVNKPLQAVFYFLVAVIVLFWVLNRMIGNDVPNMQEEWRENKGKNGRLD